jgi:hypothetical protein
MRPFSDAVFTTTPWLAFKYGHAARVREKNQVYFFPQIAVPFLVGDVFEPVEVRHRSVVEQHIDPPVLAHGEIDQRLALGRFGQMARLKGDHRSALGANHFNRSFSRGDVHVATDDRRTLSSECQGGRAAYTPARPRDDAHLARYPV